MKEFIFIFYLITKIKVKDFLNIFSNNKIHKHLHKNIQKHFHKYFYKQLIIILINNFINNFININNTIHVQNRRDPAHSISLLQHCLALPK